MIRRRLFRVLAGVVFSISLFAPLSLQADPLSRPAGLTPAESRGKLIYTTGRTPSGKQLSYRLLSGGDLLPARGVACASCHGVDGRGGKEGDVVAPDITHEVLTKPSAERQRAPYNDALLARAVTQGLDSSGNRLNYIMPRWVLSASDLQDLTAYVKRLGSEPRSNKK